MSWITDLFSSSVGSVVDSVGNAIDKLVTSDEERLKLKNELVKIQNETENKKDIIALEFEKEVTKRQASDNEHLVTRLMRPVSLAFVLVMFCFISVADNNLIAVKDAYIPVYETLLVTMVVALFGSRGAEKITKTFKGK